MRFFITVAALTLILIVGCGKFFVPQAVTGGGSGTGGGGGSNLTSAALYVANGSSPNPTIAGFSTSSQKLAVLSGSPYASGILPTTLAITPGNKSLYVGGVDGLINVYNVNSDGSLSIGNAGSPVANGIAPAAMAVDATGNWLLALDSNSLAIMAFSINATTGTLSAAGKSTVALDAGAPSHIAFSPNNQFVYISLGTGGVDVVSFDSSTGAMSRIGLLSPLPIRGAADTGLAVDAAGTTLYLGETAGNGLRALAIGVNGGLTEKSGSPYLTGLGPSAVVVDASSSHVYVSNRTDGTISGFSVSASGALVPTAGSPYATGKNPIGMVIDTNKGYLAVVCVGGSPDLQLFSFDATTTGKLVPAATATTGTDPAIPLAIVATR